MTKIDVCNQALAHIGDKRIARLDDEAQAFSPIVRYCAQFYDLARKEVLAAHRWTFAKRTAVLSNRTGTMPIIGFNFAHARPTGMLRLMSLHCGSEPVEGGTQTFSKMGIDKFQMVNGAIWSNYQYLAAFYIGDEEDVNEWHPHFTTCVARLLAHYVAGPVADDPSLSMRHREHYERIDLPNAQFYDAVQDASNENSDINTRLARSPSLAARGGYGGYPEQERDYGAGGGGTVADLDGIFESEL